MPACRQGITYMSALDTSAENGKGWLSVTDRALISRFSGGLLRDLDESDVHGVGAGLLGFGDVLSDGYGKQCRA